ncbi:MAG: hypothetical protein HY608_10670 [Planctomycetes bacterium]|nr:hypothetical protein [Planctomycetota bacterium]
MTHDNPMRSGHVPTACEAVLSFLAVAPGDRTSDEKETTARHIQACAPCQERADAYEDLDRLLPMALVPAALVPAALGGDAAAVPAAVLETARRIAEGSEPVRRMRVWPRRSLAAAGVAAAIGVVFLLPRDPGAGNSERCALERSSDPAPYPFAPAGQHPGGGNLDDSEAGGQGLFGSGERPRTSRTYSDPLEYVAQHGIDPTVPGLVNGYLNYEGEEFGIRKWACIDGILNLLGERAAPHLVLLYEHESEPDARRQLLMAMARTRDPMLLPFMQGVLSRCDDDEKTPSDRRTLIGQVIDCFLAIGTRDPSVIAALRSRLGKEERDAYALSNYLSSLHALGDPGALATLDQALLDQPSIPLLVARYTLTPEGERAGLQEKMARAVDAVWEQIAVGEAAAESLSWGDGPSLLKVLACHRDERGLLLAERLLNDGYEPTRVATARTLGEIGDPSCLPLLRKEWSEWRSLPPEPGEGASDRAWDRYMGLKDALNPTPGAVLAWAMIRCGDKDAENMLRALPIFGEWVMDARLDLGLIDAELLEALPPEVSAGPGLIAILDHIFAQDADGAMTAVRGKIRRLLEESPLRNTLESVSTLGYTPTLRDYLLRIGSIRIGDEGQFVSLCASLSTVDRIGRVLRDPPLNPADAGVPSSFHRIHAIRALRVVRPGSERGMQILRLALADAPEDEYLATLRREAIATMAELYPDLCRDDLAGRFPQTRPAKERTAILSALSRVGARDAVIHLGGLSATGEQMALVRDRIKNLGSGDFATRAASADELLALREIAAPMLWGNRDDADPEIAEQSRRILKETDPETLVVAVLAAAEEAEPRRGALLRRGMASPYPEVCCAAAFALAQAGENDGIEYLLREVSGEDEIAAAIAYQTLLAAGAPQAVDALLAGLQTDSLARRAWCGGWLSALSGERHGFDPFDGPGEPSKGSARAAWQRWFQTSVSPVRITLPAPAPRDEGVIESGRLFDLVPR